MSRWPQLPYVRTLLATLVGLSVLAFFVVAFSDGSWWPWEPFRIWLALTAAVALLAWPPRWAAVAVILWAVVASPLVAGAGRASFANTVPGSVLGTGVPSGPYGLRAGPVPVGATVFRSAGRIQWVGEGGQAPADLVAWSFVALPWPHVDRATMIGLGGNIRDDWIGQVTVARNGNVLLASGQRVDPSTRSMRPEVRELRLEPSRSGVTYAGWGLVLLAGALRFASRHRKKRRVDPASLA